MPWSENHCITDFSISEALSLRVVLRVGGSRSKPSSSPWGDSVVC